MAVTVGNRTGGRVAGTQRAPRDAGWSFTTAVIAGLPLLARGPVPMLEHPLPLAWIAGALTRVKALAENFVNHPAASPDLAQTLANLGAFSTDPYVLEGEALQALVQAEVDAIADALGAVESLDVPDDPERYLGLFVTIPPPACAAYFDPQKGQQSGGPHDRYFAREALQGNNPVVLRAVAGLTDWPAGFDATFQAVTGEPAATALSDGRVFVCDYVELAPIVGVNARGQRGWAPRALFVVGADDALVPVAIQLDRNGGPVFVPSDPGWPAARTIVRAANQAHHVLLSHLPRTHFVLEAVGVAARRQLPTGHVVRVLVEQHLGTTFAFNTTAIDAVTSTTTGWFHALLPGEPATRAQVMAAAYRERPFVELGLAGDLAARGVGVGSALGAYPYRDDGLLYWDAIRTYVTKLVDASYTSDAAVASDVDLQAWLWDLSAPGQAALKAVPDVLTRAALVDLLQVVVWVATAGHAAIQDPLTNEDVLAPAAPNAIYADAPAPGSAPAGPLLPPLRQAIHQLVVNFFGDLQLNRVGEPDLPDFTNPAWLPAVFAFRGALKAVETEIAARNAARLQPYRPLETARVPRSIHI